MEDSVDASKHKQFELGKGETWETELVARILRTCGPSCVALMTNFYFTKEGKDGELIKSAEGNGIGSGFVVKGQRIYTCFHVVYRKNVAVKFGEDSFVAEGPAKRIQIFTNAGKSPRIAYIESVCPLWDLALLKFVDEGDPISEIEILPRCPYLGETVVAISSNYGHQNTVHKGMVNHPNAVNVIPPEVINVIPEVIMIEHDCHVGSGSSGCAIISGKGFLGGMNMSVSGRKERLGFAMSSYNLKLFLDHTLSLKLIGPNNLCDKLVPVLLDTGPSGSAPSVKKRKKDKMATS